MLNVSIVPNGRNMQNVANLVNVANVPIVSNVWPFRKIVAMGQRGRGEEKTVFIRPRISVSR